MKSFDILIGKTTLATVAENRQIKQVISRIVPARTASQIQFCRVEAGRLRITVSAAAWISRLRFSERHIIDALRARHFDCHSASYHVSPDDCPPQRKTIRRAERSGNGAESLEKAADAISQDPDDRLRQELKKLARTLKSAD